jgi:hypothetical protein
MGDKYDPCGEGFPAVPGASAFCPKDRENRERRALTRWRTAGGRLPGSFARPGLEPTRIPGWVEERTLLNGANKWVAEAIEDIRASALFL